MESAESLWRVGGRFLRLVLLLDAVILAGVVGLTLLDGSTSAAAIERGTWIVAAVIAGMWLVSQLGAAPFASLSPLISLRQIADAPVPAPQRAFEMTWLTITILVTLSLVALSLRAVFL